MCLHIAANQPKYFQRSSGSSGSGSQAAEDPQQGIRTKGNFLATENKSFHSLRWLQPISGRVGCWGWVPKVPQEKVCWKNTKEELFYVLQSWAFRNVKTQGAPVSRGPCASSLMYYGTSRKTQLKSLEKKILENSKSSAHIHAQKNSRSSWKAIHGDLHWSLQHIPNYYYYCATHP